MNPTAIYSKSGKGVQEAAGKTSLLKRGDRVVLSAIDGRATLADVAQKVGKAFDAGFEQLIVQLDKDGFIREVSSGTASAAKPGAKPTAKPAPTAPMDAASDLDFSSFAPPPKPASAPKPAAPPPKAGAAAGASTSALNKAREEAEAKAAAEREKQKAEAEAKVRAELEAKMRAEAEEKAKEAATSKGKAEAAARLQAEADAKIKAARDAAVRAAAEAKAKADAEARRAREEAEKAKREAEAKAEQARREAAEMKKRLEEERRQLEEERKRHEEEARKKEEERAERRRREEEEEQARRAQREEEERKAEEEREARRKQREEEDRREEEERAARKQEKEEQRRREEAEAEAEEQTKAAQKKAKPEEPKPAASGASFSDTLLSDLASFGKKDDEDRKEKEEVDRKAKAEEAKRREREEEERREREEEEEKERKRRAKEEAKRKEKEEEEAREREEEEAKERKRKEKEEAKRREKEAEEAKAKEEEEKKHKKDTKKDDGDIPITDDDLSDGDVKRDQRELAKAARAAPRPKEAARVKLPPPVSGPSVRRKPVKWGKPVAIVLFLLLAGGLGVAHLMPIDIAGYERAASEALGQPVKIGSGRLWLFSGSLQLRLQGVTVGDGVKIANVHAFPTLGSLSEQKKAFSRIDLEGLSLPQGALGGALFARAKADNFSVERIVVHQLELTGPLVFPKNLEADIALDADGALRSINLRGADGLVARLAPKDRTIDVEVTAGGFTLPIAPEVAFSSFGLKGSATRQGMQVEKWDGTLLNGSVSGTANVRWGGTWSVDGVFTIRGINAAVFAPALLSEGRGEGTAKFQLSGADPAKLGASGRFEGNFTVNSGALGSIDLNQALATGGKRASGRTPFTEMTGQAVYQAGAVALRNVTITAGSAGNMNAGASVDVAPSGALSGRIVADVRTPNQMLRATLNLGGTVKDPQVRN